MYERRRSWLEVIGYWTDREWVQWALAVPLTLLLIWWDGSYKKKHSDAPQVVSVAEELGIEKPDLLPLTGVVGREE